MTSTTYRGQQRTVHNVFATVRFLVQWVALWDDYIDDTISTTILSHALVRIEEEDDDDG